MKRRLILVWLSCAIVAACGVDSRDSALFDINSGSSGFLTRTMEASNDVKAYSLFVPHDYTPSKKYPVIVFLHGMGEAGKDGTANLRAGLGPVVADKQFRFDYICVFPQSYSGNWNADDAPAVLQVLDAVRTRYNVDDSRVYLSGFSSGAYGAWTIAAKHPERFAAVVPVSGFAAEKSDIERLAASRMPVWAFHNSGDPVVHAENTRRTVGQLKAAGGQARYTEFTDNSHNAWQAAFTNPQLYAWLAEQRAGRLVVTVRAPVAAREIRREPLLKARDIPAKPMVPTPY